MKFIISILAATALTVTVCAAPAKESTPTISPPFPTVTSIPSANNSTRPGRTTSPFTSTDDSALFDSLVRYDYETADKVLKDYYTALYGNNTIHRTNSVSKAAASTDLLPFCVGISSDPARVKIFKDRMTCDIDGFYTLFIFTAHTKFDKHQAPHPICVGSASGPSRSLLFSRKTSCSENGWTSDFHFYESGRHGEDSAVNPQHESTFMWQAYEPWRMMLYPYYRGDVHGWIYAYNLQYRSRYRLARYDELTWIRIRQDSHAAIHKKISISSIPNAVYSRCIFNLVQMLTTDFIYRDRPFSIQGPSNERFIQDCLRDECSDLVNKASIRFAQYTVNEVTSVEAIINGKVYAAMSISGNTYIPPQHTRLAFHESARTGKPVMVAEQRDKSNMDSVVALIQDTFVTIGSQGTYSPDL
ncbi:hypothetical protein FBU30_003327 [Linnemannia zychae]|nr:hypothetical protein FBU30_003327 [Linnemannia zychae]